MRKVLWGPAQTVREVQWGPAVQLGGGVQQGPAAAVEGFEKRHAELVRGAQQGLAAGVGDASRGMFLL